MSLSSAGSLADWATSPRSVFTAELRCPGAELGLPFSVAVIVVPYLLVEHSGKHIGYAPSVVLPCGELA
jgi:hypothetical protein